MTQIDGDVTWTWARARHAAENTVDDGSACYVLVEEFAITANADRFAKRAAQPKAAPRTCVVMGNSETSVHRDAAHGRVYAYTRACVLIAANADAMRVPPGCVRITDVDVSANRRSVVGVA